MKNKLIFTFIENKGDSSESTLMSIVEVDISKVQPKIIRKIPVTKTLKDQFYVNDLIPLFEKHLNDLWKDEELLEMQLKHSEKIKRSIAVLISSVKKNHTNIDGCICGLEELEN